jgi:hypothetical protein
VNVLHYPLKCLSLKTRVRQLLFLSPVQPHHLICCCQYLRETASTTSPSGRAESGPATVASGERGPGTSHRATFGMKIKAVRG